MSVLTQNVMYNIIIKYLNVVNNFTIDIGKRVYNNLKIKLGIGLNYLLHIIGMHYNIIMANRIVISIILISVIMIYGTCLLFVSNIILHLSKFVVYNIIGL